MVYNSKNQIVSIITPCYNGEKYLNRYFESILNQSYKEIQLIFINDGSVDDTENIVKRMKKRLDKELYEFVYIKQINGGAASALHNGLKKVKGKYLLWSDVDDILSKDAIYNKVSFLECNDEYGFVMSQAELHEGYKSVIRKREKNNDYLFDDLILENDIPCYAGIYMFKMKCFKDANPNLYIYPSRGGQNWQMLLPMAYKYKCGKIDDIEYTIISHEDSHSRRVKSFDEVMRRINDHEQILLDTVKNINGINDNDLKEYTKIIELKYLHRRFNECYFYKNITIFKYLKKLIFKHDLELKELIKVLLLTIIYSFNLIKCKYNK